MLELHGAEDVSDDRSERDYTAFAGKVRLGQHAQQRFAQRNE